MTRFPVSLRDDIAAHVARVEPNPGAWLLRLREIADRLGLNVTRIDWSGSLITAVHAMVREAENQGRYTETEIRLAASLTGEKPAAAKPLAAERFWVLTQSRNVYGPYDTRYGAREMFNICMAECGNALCIGVSPDGQVNSYTMC